MEPSGILKEKNKIREYLLFFDFLLYLTSSSDLSNHMKETTVLLERVSLEDI